LTEPAKAARPLNPDAADVLSDETRYSG
jgi:hypothetical protein